MTPRQIIGRILLETAMHHQVKLDEMQGPCRRRPVVYARMEAMWRVRTELMFSLPHIGRLFNRDHTSVLHAIQKVEASIAETGGWPVMNKKRVYGPFDPFGPVRRVRIPQIDATERARAQANIINTFWASRGIDAQARPMRENGGRVVVRSKLRMIAQEPEKANKNGHQSRFQDSLSTAYGVY